MTEKRGRGRPRREGADEEILGAAMELLREKGYRELTVDAIAERVGVAKTTIYRRWPTKGALIAAAMPAPNTDVDLVELIAQVRDVLAMIGDDRTDPDLAHVVAPYRSAIQAQLDPFAADLLIAPMLYARELPDPDELVNAILHGVSGGARTRPSRRRRSAPTRSSAAPAAGR